MCQLRSRRGRLDGDGDLFGDGMLNLLDVRGQAFDGPSLMPFEIWCGGEEEISKIVGRCM